MMAAWERSHNPRDTRRYRVARQFSVIFPHCELRLPTRAGHDVRVDEPALVAHAVTAP